MAHESLTEKIQQMAATDEAFRRKLLADPRAAIAGMLGRELPAGLKVQVIEETANSHVIVLPPRTPTHADELSEEQLSQISGGAGCPYCMFTKGTYCFFTK